MNEFLIKYFGENLFYLVSFFTATTAIIPLLVKPGEIFNKKYRWYKRLRWAGYSIIIASSLGIYFNNLQNNFNDIKSDKKELALKDSLKKSYNTSIDTMQRRFIDGNKDIIKAVIISLGTYGYKLDSSNKSLVRIVRDSSKTTIINQDLPVLSMCNNSGISIVSEKDNEYEYRISLCNVNAGSTDFDIECHAVLVDSASGKYYYLSKFRPIRKEMKLGKDQQVNNYYSVKSSYSFTDLCLAVRGTYKTLDGSKASSIDDVFYYEMKSKKSGFLVGPDRDKVIAFIESNKDKWNATPYKKSYY